LSNGDVRQGDIISEFSGTRFGEYYVFTVLWDAAFTFRVAGNLWF